jgi:hypothetical protein
LNPVVSRCDPSTFCDRRVTIRAQRPGEQPSIKAVSELALLVVEFDGVADQLLAAHVDDGRGYCHGCWFPQTPAPIWPCTLFAIAREAHALDRSRRLPAR